MVEGGCTLLDGSKFNFLQALDKSQLGEIIREKEEKLDTPGKKPQKLKYVLYLFFPNPLKLNKEKKKYFGTSGTILRFISNMQC